MEKDVTITKESRLEVPGATLFYRIQGDGPLLLFIQGGDGNADGGHIVEELSSAYTVVTYDPRGLSRSTISHPPDGLRLETHGDDAHHLLSALTDVPALLFGTSRGAMVGLDLVARHGAQVRLLLAHEPPLTQLLPEAERTEAVEGQLMVEALYAREGSLAAMKHFAALVRLDFSDREPGCELPTASPGRAANLAFFLTYDAPAVRSYRLDMNALKAAPTRIIPAAGEKSHAIFPHRCAAALAAELGEPLTEFPGGHAGPTTHPRAFAARLGEVFAAANMPGKR
jgi:pimeloyl-ACP methyl ester carboxylesterase